MKIRINDSWLPVKILGGFIVIMWLTVVVWSQGQNFPSGILSQISGGGVLFLGSGGTYDLVANGGADPTGVNDSTSAVNAALAYFSGKVGGTISLCGKFLLTQTIKILQNNPGIRFMNACGKSGANIVVNQHGGATFYSTTNSNVPNPTVAPTLIDQAAQGGTWSSIGPWYFKYSYSNGNGETLVSPSTQITLGATTDSINWGNGVPYNSGGWAVNMYCSSDNINFFLQTASNFKSSGGSFGGPPFLFGGPTNNGAHQTSCTTSGSSPASSNTATKGMILFQLGDYGSSAALAGGAEFDNIAFYDPNNVLAAAYVVANAQRTMCFSCEFDGFNWNGTFTGNAGANPASSGSAQFETGGIGVAHLNSDGTNQTSNFNSLIEPRFENNHLAMLALASDDTLYGGDCNAGNTNAMCIDFPGGNIRIWGLHEGIANSASISQLNYIRGQNAGTLSGAMWYLKCETLNLVTTKGCVALAFATGNRLDIRPVSGTATATQAAVVFDANSGQNEVIVTNTNVQVCFSDGTTINKDPAGTNTIFCAKDGTANVPNSIVSTGAVPSLTGTGACATFSTQVGGQWNGTFKCTGTSGAATITITFSGTAQNGYNCDAKDETTTADTLTPTVPGAPTTTCTFSAAAIASGDVIRFFAFQF